jgi:hypothetical protein
VGRHHQGRGDPPSIRRVTHPASRRGCVPNILIESLPGVPTQRESGVTGFDFSEWIDG